MLRWKKRWICLILIFGIYLTPEQYSNLLLVHKEVQRQIPTFIAFRGHTHNLECIGADEDDVKRVLKNMNIEELKRQADDGNTA